MTLLRRSPRGALPFARSLLVWGLLVPGLLVPGLLVPGLLLGLLLGPASPAAAQGSTPASGVGDASGPPEPATTGSGVEIRVESALGEEGEARVAPRARIERCMAAGARRLPALGGTTRFQIRWHRGSLVVVLVESTLGDHGTEACLRRAIGSERRFLQRELATPELVSVEVSAPTQVRFCHPNGTEVSSGRGTPECALGDAARASAATLRSLLEQARVRPDQTLQESCGFTHVAVWLDARGRLVSYGGSSVNSDAESPALHEYVLERATAFRVLAARVRPLRHDAGALRRLVFMLGGCD